MPTIGENIRMLRKSRGYTQEKFAQAINSNQANVTAWERNERKPTYETIQLIANTFKVPVYSILPLAESGVEDNYLQEIAELLHREPKFRTFFDTAKYLSHEDWDVIITVTNAIARDRVL